MVELVKVLLKILARGLPQEWKCPPDVLDALAENNPSIPMRLLHYGPQPIKDERQFGGILCLSPSLWNALLYVLTDKVGDHTDFGCVTILLQEMGTEGLEVWYPPTETWIPVPPKEHEYVINIGDMVQKFTGGYYRSARHRVVTFTENHRYSVPFFLNGQLKLNCITLDGSGSETIVGEHIRGRLLETMGKAGEKLK
jgi:isopenicillin N synthase-like dioxygenase